MEDYKIIEELSSNDNADVFLVMNKEDKRIRIMKKIKNGDILPYEIMLGKRTKNLVSIYEVDEDENVVIMEYVQGRILSQCNIRDDINQVRRIAVQLCDAVSVLHRNNLIHRDIKPQNIMITDDGCLKLIDFDIARIYKSNMSKDTRYIGTDGFAPPEQYGFAQTDIRTDVYAIGAVLYDIVSDGAPIQRLNEYTGELCAVIEKCLRLDPNDRYQTVDELKNALVLPAGIPEQTGSDEGHKNQKYFIFILLAIIVFLFALGGFIYLLKMPEETTDDSVSIVTSDRKAEKDDDMPILFKSDIYNEESEPVGVSSLRIEREKAPSGHYYPIIYVRVHKKSEQPPKSKVMLTFESFDEDGNSLGTDIADAEFEAGEFRVENIHIAAYTHIKENEFLKNDGVVSVIKLVDIKETPIQ